MDGSCWKLCDRAGRGVITCFGLEANRREDNQTGALKKRSQIGLLTRVIRQVPRASGLAATIPCPEVEVLPPTVETLPHR